MSKLSNYSEAALLDLLYNGDAFTAPDPTYIALYTDDPTDADTGTEVSGGAYARAAVNANGGASPTWALAVVDGIGYKVTNAHDVTFPTATASWGTVTHVGIRDAASGGNLLHHFQMDNAKTVGIGDVAKFEAGLISLRLE